MSTEVPRIPPQGCPFGATSAWLLVSVHTEPVGSLIIEVPPEGLSGDQISDGHDRVGRRDRDQIRPSRQRALRCRPFWPHANGSCSAAPNMTVMVCTRERPERLEDCLESLSAQDYPNFSVLVIDNFPAHRSGPGPWSTRLASPLITYVARTRERSVPSEELGALTMAGDGIVASIDDDETADPHWLAELARGFTEHPEADAVTGVMAPGELETWAQVWFEQYGGHNKLRGFTPAVFSPRRHT